jgi:quinol monooxygenase YgiN
MNFDSTDDREKMVTILRAHRHRCLADEPGTLQFDLALPEDNDKALLLYESYVDKDAFEAHREGESLKTVNAEIKEKGIKLALSATSCTLTN